jgi:hypothetical protein
MGFALFRGFALSVLGLAASGCDGSLLAPPPAAAEEIIIHVQGDPDEPVANATLGTSQGALGRTDATGTARIKLDGPDGTRFEIAIVCPEGYAPPAKPLRIALHRGSKTPEYFVQCKHLMRTVVIALKANVSAATPIPLGGVPILHLGQTVGRTDETGAALISMDSKVGESVTLTFDTRDPRYQFLRPQSPEASFTVGDSDDLFTYAQPFGEERPKPVVRAAYRPPLPVRM